MTTDGGRDDEPRYSPDGKWIAFEHNSRELRVIDPVSKEEKLIAYFTVGAKTFGNVHIAAVASVPSFTPGAGRGELPREHQRWLAGLERGRHLHHVRDGATHRAGRSDPRRSAAAHEDQFRDLFKDEQTKTPAPPTASPDAAAASTPVVSGFSRPKTVKIAFDDIRRRASVLPVGVDVNRQEISPDGKWLLLTASAAGQQNLYTYPIDELSREPAIARQLTSTPGVKRSAHFSPDSKEVYYLDRGRVFNITLERREPKAIAVSAEFDVDFAREARSVPAGVDLPARPVLRREEYGVDWNALRGMYEPRVAGTRTPEEMRRVISLMLGAERLAHGDCGAGRRRRHSVVSRSTSIARSTALPAACACRRSSRSVQPPSAGSRPADYILQIDGRAIDRRTNLDEPLDHTIGKRIALSVAASPTAAPARGGSKAGESGPRDRASGAAPRPSGRAAWRMTVSRVVPGSTSLTAGWMLVAA